MSIIAVYGLASIGGGIWRRCKHDIIAIGICSTSCTSISELIPPFCLWYNYFAPYSFQKDISKKYVLETTIGDIPVDRLLAVSYCIVKVAKIIMDIGKDL